MSDVKQYLGKSPVDDLAMQDRLNALEEWNEQIAAAKAAELEIELTDAHWEVLNFLRKHYIESGLERRAHKLTHMLVGEFKNKGGNKYLYTLFPDGPITQGSYIAGIPAPADAIDTSFGSVQ